MKLLADLGNLFLGPLQGPERESPFEALFHHVLPHEQGELFGLKVWNFQIFQLISVALIFVLFAGVARAIRNGSGGFLQRVMAGWVLWIREEMVYPYLGEERGRLFLPFFLAMFFFIAIMNSLGIVPFGVTPTASIFVTGAMATVTLVVMVAGGMIVQGPFAFWRNLVPHGVPWWLVPLMFVLELVGLLVKPFALTIRLFANMTGGHLVLLSFMGMIFYFGTDIGPGAGAASSPVWVGLSVFIMIIEVFVALLQAYIFTVLSIIFVGMSLQPEH